MPIPHVLRDTVEQTRRSILENPDGEFGPIKRKAFVAFWTSLELEHAVLTYQFLNIVTAEHVAPIYEASVRADWLDNWYHKEMPRRLIHIAKATLTEELAPEAVGNLTASQHYVIGNMADGLACNAEMALSAANKALSVCTSDTAPMYDFDSLSRIAMVGTYRVDPTTSQMERQDTPAIKGKDFSDKDWARHGSSDAAACAAIAASCSAESYTPDVDKLKAFWDWWFTRGISEAWYMTGYRG